MNDLVKRVSCVAMAGALVVGAMTGCGAKADGIDGTKTAVTVNGEKISLGEVSFYAHYSGANIYTYYYNYFGMTNLFDTVMDEETGQTYGENLSTSAAEELTDMTLLKQHAEEYDVVIDDEAKAAIEAAAQAYIDENDEEVRAKIGASKEDVVALMERQTYQSLMYDALAEDVDTEVSDEEAQQTSVSYVSFALVTEEEMEEDSEDLEAEEETEGEEEAEAAEEAEGEEAAEAEDTPTVEEQNSVKRADAAALLAAVQAKGSTLTTEEFEEAVKAMDDSYEVETGTFTKADPTDTNLDSCIAEAAAGLADGTVVPSVIEGEDSAYIYVAMVDKVIDEDATAEKTEEIISGRKQENYDNLLAGWKESSEITTDEEALALIVLTDAAPVAFKQAETDEAAEETEEAEEAEAEVAEETEETAETAEAADAEAADAETAEETAETADAETAEAADAETAETTEAADAETADAETTEAADASTAETAVTADAETAETAEAADAETAEAAEAATAETAEAATTETAETAEAATAETAEAADTTTAETTDAATAETAETAATAEAATTEAAENAG